MLQEYHQSGSNFLLGLIWVQTVCKGYQQATKVAISRLRVNLHLYAHRGCLECSTQVKINKIFERKIVNIF